MTLLWICCCLFCAVVIELMIGSHGMVAPAFAVAGFYFTVIHGWRRPLPLLLVAATVLDLSYGRQVPASMLLLIPVQALGMYWRKHGDCSQPLLQSVPGGLLGLTVGVGYVLLLRVPGSSPGPQILVDGLWVLIQCTLAGVVLLPLCCAYVDRAAKAMAFRQYDRVKQR